MPQSTLREEELNKQLTEASALHEAYPIDTIWPIVEDAVGEPLKSAGHIPHLDADVIGCLHRGQLPGRQLCQQHTPEAHAQNEPSDDLAGQAGEARPWAPGLRG